VVIQKYLLTCLQNETGLAANNVQRTPLMGDCLGVAVGLMGSTDPAD